MNGLQVNAVTRAHQVFMPTSKPTFGLHKRITVTHDTVRFGQEVDRDFLISTLPDHADHQRWHPFFQQSTRTVDDLERIHKFTKRNRLEEDDLDIALKFLNKTAPARYFKSFWAAMSSQYEGDRLEVVLNFLADTPLQDKNLKNTLETVRKLDLNPYDTQQVCDFFNDPAYAFSPFKPAMRTVIENNTYTGDGLTAVLKFLKKAPSYDPKYLANVQKCFQADDFSDESVGIMANMFITTPYSPSELKPVFILLSGYNFNARQHEAISSFVTQTHWPEMDLAWALGAANSDDYTGREMGIMLTGFRESPYTGDARNRILRNFRNYVHTEDELSTWMDFLYKERYTDNELKQVFSTIRDYDMDQEGLERSLQWLAFADEQGFRLDSALSRIPYLLDHLTEQDENQDHNDAGSDYPYADPRRTSTPKHPYGIQE